MFRTNNTVKTVAIIAAATVLLTDNTTEAQFGGFNGGGFNNAGFNGGFNGGGFNNNNNINRIPATTVNTVPTNTVPANPNQILTAGTVGVGDTLLRNNFATPSQPLATATTGPQFRPPTIPISTTVPITAPTTVPSIPSVPPTANTINNNIDVVSVVLNNDPVAVGNNIPITQPRLDSTDLPTNNVVGTNQPDLSFISFPSQLDPNANAIISEPFINSNNNINNGFVPNNNGFAPNTPGVIPNSTPGFIPNTNPGAIPNTNPAFIPNNNPAFIPAQPPPNTNFGALNTQIFDPNTGLFINPPTTVQPINNIGINNNNVGANNNRELNPNLSLNPVPFTPLPAELDPLVDHNGININNIGPNGPIINNNNNAIGLAPNIAPNTVNFDPNFALNNNNAIPTAGGTTVTPFASNQNRDNNGIRVESLSRAIDLTNLANQIRNL